MDSDEEASTDKQVSAESSEPGSCLVNLENKPDLCLLSLGLVDRDGGCGRSPAIITCPESNSLSFNNVASTNHVSSMNTINSSNKMPGVRDEKKKESIRSHAVIYRSAHFPHRCCRVAGGRSWIFMPEPAMLQRVGCRSQHPQVSLMSCHPNPFVVSHVESLTSLQV